MSRRRKSRNIGFRAFEDTDADLVCWWESMPAGERSMALRQLLRAAIDQGQPARGNGHMAPEIIQVAADTAWLRAALMDLPGYLEGLLSRLPVAQVQAQTVIAQETPSDQPSMDRAAIDRRRANMKHSSW